MPSNVDTLEDIDDKESESYPLSSAQGGWALDDPGWGFFPNAVITSACVTRLASSSASQHP
jgi:hypothetical protein